MYSTTKPLLSMTAADLMTADVVRFQECMPLREAARRLVTEGISGAPVVDDQGVCVGVLSSGDFLRFLARTDPKQVASDMARPLSCSFQRPHSADGKRIVACTLPLGACSVQTKHTTSDGSTIVACNQSHCVFADWQTVELEELPLDEVRRYMTPDPVLVSAEETIQQLCRRMIDAHVHRVIVVDDCRRPVGIISSTDVLAAVSYAENETDQGASVSAGRI